MGKTTSKIYTGWLGKCPVYRWYKVQFTAFGWEFITGEGKGTVHHVLKKRGSLEEVLWWFGREFLSLKDSDGIRESKSECSKISGFDHPALCDTTCASQSWNGVYAGWCSVPYCKDDMRDAAEEQHQGFRLTAVFSIFLNTIENWKFVGRDV